MLADALHQTCTMWILEDMDIYGRVIWSAPMTFKARWQDKQQLIRTAQGDEKMSRAVVYTDTHVPLTSRIFLGETDETDPTKVQSHEPMAYERMVDLDGNTVGWKVYV